MENENDTNFRLSSYDHCIRTISNIIPALISDSGAIAPLTLLTPNKRTPGYAGPDEPGYRHESIKRKQRGVCVAESHLGMIGLWGSFLCRPYLHVWCRRNLPNIIINQSYRANRLSSPRPVRKAAEKDAANFSASSAELQHWIPNHERNYNCYALNGTAAFNGPDSTWINWVKSPPISIHEILDATSLPCTPRGVN